MPDMEKVIKGLEGMIDYFFDIFRNDTDSYKCAKAQEYSDCAIDAIALLKEQKVDTSKYQYKYDHTDCIWYRDSRSRCPVTCSQYRDGWNDAMDFIFKNGVGYRPYKRR